MNKILALSILGCESEDQAEEAFELYFFEVKQKLIQTKLATPLLKLQVKKVQIVCELEEVLFGTQTIINKQPFANITGTNYRSIFKSIQENISYSKLLISSANNGVELDYALMNLTHSVSYYEGFMLDNFKHKITNSIDQPKASELPDVMELNVQISRLAEKEDNSSYSSEILNNFEDEFPLIAHELKRIAGYFVDDRIVKSEE